VPFLTNSTLLERKQVPKHLVVVGGSYVGLEFAQAFRRFGADVTVVEMGPRLIGHEDEDVSAAVQEIMEAEGIAVRTGAECISLAPHTKGVAVSVKCTEGDPEIIGSDVLLAVGRRPNTDDLGLDKAGIATDQSGYIKVNGRLETNVPGVWALGDCKGGPAFTHISYNDFQIVHANLIEGRNLTIENRIVPYSVFTDPQLGRVGMTEKEARQQGKKLKIGKIPMSSVARAIERDETAGLMKLVVDAANDRILGAAILATEGGELIQMLGSLMLAGLPYTLLKGAVYIHPTLAEGFFALMESVQPVD